MNELLFKDLGEMPYEACWNLQERIMQHLIDEKRRGSRTENYLLAVSHPHVITLGKNANPENLLASKVALTHKGVSYVQTNRGGDITYHGPGQLVIYPILDLENFKPDIHLYLRNLEEVVILLLKNYGLEAFRRPKETGVWVLNQTSRKPAKICAMGVRTSRWVTMHGLALNVNTDLSFFDYIIPCGIRDKGVTSIQELMGEVVDMAFCKSLMFETFGAVFSAKVSPWHGEL